MDNNGQEAKRRAVFLDRDGVLTEEPPYYAHRSDQMRLTPRAAEAVKLLKDRNFVTIVVTNQAGIARGYYQEGDMRVFHRTMCDALQKTGAVIDAIYFCAHHPEAEIEEYRKSCQCRKPAPGMILDAARDFHIDLRASFVVGDMWSDIAAGRDVGCRTVLVRTGRGVEALEKADQPPCDYIADDLYGAAKFICRSRRFVTKERGERIR